MTRVLIVEDEAIIAMSLRRVLEGMGYDVPATAATGQEAITLAEEASPDLVLMDIMLVGEMDGIEAAGVIRSKFDLPVIYLTAYSDEEILQRAKITDPFGYIIKPFKDRELHTTIEMALYKHRAERKLRESEEWLSTTLNGIGDAVIATDTSEIVSFMNPIAVELTGWSAEEAVGRPLREVFNIINELTREPCPSPATEVIKKGVIVGLANNTTLIAKDGAERIIADSGAPIRDRKGDIAGVVIVFRDVTEKKRAEEMIGRQNEFLKNLLESLTHPFYVIGADDYVIRMANSACKFEALDEHSTCYSLTHHRDTPCGGEDHPCTIEEIKKTGKSVILEHIHYDEEGNKRNFEIHGYPIFDSSGKVVEVIEYSIDISARKNLEEQLRLSQRLESVGRLAGGVAHDFNNLLTAILGYGERAYDILPQGHEVKEHLTFILDAGQKAADLTAQLLAFSRKQVLELKLFDLGVVVGNLIKMLSRVIGEDIVLEFHPQTGLRNIMADKSRLEQILMNLAINARAAMPNGGRLGISLENVELDQEYAGVHDEVVPGRYVLLTVSDNGEGMSPEVRRRVFEPFFSAREGGHGLGLSTVYGIVRQHKGYVFVYSEPEEGTVFKIYFPAVEGEVEHVPEPIKVSSLRGTETILVVDDEPSIRRLLLDTLEPLGYRVLEASSGEDAYRISSEAREDIHVLLTDMIMPGMNGNELSLKILEQRPSTLVMVMSGYAVDMLSEEGRPDEGFVFIQKPISPKKIAARLREELDGGTQQ